MTDVLARASPSRARSVNERIQADDIYKVGMILRVIDSTDVLLYNPFTDVYRRYQHPDKHHQNQIFLKATLTLSIRAHIVSQGTNTIGVVLK